MHRRTILVAGLLAGCSKVAPMHIWSGARYVPPPPVVSGFYRKPVIPTPTAPTPIDYYFVDGDNGNDANAGTELSPWKTVNKVEQNVQAGRCFYYKGTVLNSAGNSDRIGQSGVSGTLANPVQHKKWPGAATPILRIGGGGSGYPVIYLTAGQQYYWIDGLQVEQQAGADYGIMGNGGSRYIKFLNMSIVNTGVQWINAPDSEFWDSSWSGVYGNIAANTGDALNISQGSDRCRVMRCSLDGRFYHMGIIVGNINADTSTATGVEIFDTYCKNPPAGGINIGGGSRSAHVHWCRSEDQGTVLEGGNPGTKDNYNIQAPDTIFEFNLGRNSGARGLQCSSYLFGGSVQSFSNCNIRFNVFTGCYSVGIYVHHGVDVDPNIYQVNNVIENNICWGNNQGPLFNNGASGEYFGDYYPIWVDHYSTGGNWNVDAGDWGGNIIRNNVIGRTTSDTTGMLIYVKNGANRFYTQAQLVANNPAHADNLFAVDPLFVDQLNWDVHLQAGSPCRNAGYPTSGVSYLETAPDIGAFEYGGTD